MNLIRIMLILLLLGLRSENARADGGVVRLRETQGPFAVTIFTASELFAKRPADISVMVQSKDSSEAVLDATVDLRFIAPASLGQDTEEEICGQPIGVSSSQTSDTDSGRFTVPATRQQASNKLLYAALVRLNRVGNWRLRALVERGAEVCKFDCNIPVEPPPGRLVHLAPLLLLPPVLVGLFAVNQRLRRVAYV
jgi:hypothetical protein